MTDTDGRADDTGALAARLEATVADAFDDDAAWTVATDGDGVTILLPDRTLTVERRDGPDGAARWTLALSADGDTVSKFGPFASVEALDGKVRSLLDAEVRYTVCCDG